MNIFQRLESNVRAYSRSFPVVFDRAAGSLLYDEHGRRYIDFLAGAGSLNYGHNDPPIHRAVLEHLERNGILHGLDMHTAAKRRFLEAFERHVLWRIEPEYKVQFTGPTGTNAVEAAMKLARRVTGRTNVIAFTNGFHGVSLGSLAATGNSHFREAAGLPLSHTTPMPYAGYLGDDLDTVDILRRFLEDGGSGVDRPAAAIVETVQGEGGVNVAGLEWLRKLEALCREFGMLLIVDDIQVGCGRTGPFFSFERAGIRPDLVTLSKSLGAIGLPMAVLLLRPEHDQWEPGEHNGTFRGNNLAFVAATAALEHYWCDTSLTDTVREKGRTMGDALLALTDRHADLGLKVRGLGMIWGLDCGTMPGLATAVTRAAFQRNLVVETSGSDSQVVKLLPPLTIETKLLIEGLEILHEAFHEAVGESTKASMEASR